MGMIASISWGWWANIWKLGGSGLLRSCCYCSVWNAGSSLRHRQSPCPGVWALPNQRLLDAGASSGLARQLLIGPVGPGDCQKADHEISACVWHCIFASYRFFSHIQCQVPRFCVWASGTWPLTGRRGGWKAFRKPPSQNLPCPSLWVCCGAGCCSSQPGWRCPVSNRTLSLCNTLLVSAVQRGRLHSRLTLSQLSCHRCWWL